jgi:hypothetical protein
MANETMTLIATQTLGTAAASVSFSSIPQTYTDLQLVISARTARAADPDDAVSVKFNSNTSNYTNRILQGNGSTASSTTGFFGQGYFVATATAAGATSNTFGNSSVYVPNYTGSTNKSVTSDNVIENNATFSPINLIAGLWSNTSAITSITCDNFSVTNFQVGSTFSLYGILKGSGGATVS